ncbi:hypothetical protein NMY3_00730 [Candidatus Nitrosocosmicus oleophilus]|uniref:Uncharacterized protein n=1 Tax=Candidatus Nitrosocosmicus oleophilus TaxID=1353260 RepID=A0A654LX62_9ARCH|nr:hypothetical protein [Candidatus Nitrosocosmicus oleophilus]ALI34939.1 hypothetical protein NMY3_00730 [Candidatus Nitrosocosmicus oleophilus]
MFEDRDIAGIDATVIAGILILAGLTTINPTISEQLRISEAFAITWEMILPFAISAVFALAGRVKIAKILTAAGFILLIVLLFAVWQETYVR